MPHKRLLGISTRGRDGRERDGDERRQRKPEKEEIYGLGKPVDMFPS